MLNFGEPCQSGVKKRALVICGLRLPHMRHGWWQGTLLGLAKNTQRPVCATVGRRVCATVGRRLLYTVQSLRQENLLSGHCETQRHSERDCLEEKNGATSSGNATTSKALIYRVIPHG